MKYVDFDVYGYNICEDKTITGCGATFSLILTQEEINGVEKFLEKIKKDCDWDGITDIVYNKKEGGF